VEQTARNPTEKEMTRSKPRNPEPKPRPQPKPRVTWRFTDWAAI
jgi:hypothetical protein